MKKLSIACAAAIILMACGDNSGNSSESGSSVDTAMTVPQMNSSDNRGDQLDTAAVRGNMGTADSISGGIGSGGGTGTGSGSGSGSGGTQADSGSGTGSGR